MSPPSPAASAPHRPNTGSAKLPEPSARLCSATWRYRGSARLLRCWMAACSACTLATYVILFVDMVKANAAEVAACDAK